MAEDYMQLYTKALEGLKTGGKKLEASLQEIEEGKRQAIAGGQAGLVRGGLGGTTVMGAVPLAAEKTAARKRLGARGEAEQTYLTTLASFAAFAQRGEEAARQREFAAEQTRLGQEFATGEAVTQREFQARQAELGRVAATGTTQYGRAPSTQQPSLAEFMREFDVRGGGGDVASAGGVTPTGGGYAPQFPTMYDQGGGGGPAAPSMPGGGIVDTPWPIMAPLGGAVYGSQEAFETYGLEPSTGSVPMGRRTAPTIEEPGQTGAGAYQSWLTNYLSRPGAYVTGGTKERWLKNMGRA